MLKILEYINVVKLLIFLGNRDLSSQYCITIEVSSLIKKFIYQKYKQKLKHIITHLEDKVTFVRLVFLCVVQVLGLLIAKGKDSIVNYGITL